MYCGRTDRRTDGQTGRRLFPGSAHYMRKIFFSIMGILYYNFCEDDHSQVVLSDSCHRHIHGPTPNQAKSTLFFCQRATPCDPDDFAATRTPPGSHVLSDPRPARPRDPANPAGGQCGTCRRPVRHLPATSAAPAGGQRRTLHRELSHRPVPAAGRGELGKEVTKSTSRPWKSNT